jgi:cell shape-determining protein MreC
MNENKPTFESYAIMLNELKSALELNKIKDAKIERLTKENIALKNDLCFWIHKDYKPKY